MKERRETGAEEREVWREETGEEMLDYMHKYWLASWGTDEGLWRHEWAKHGTCVSTLNPSCYTHSEDEDQNKGGEHREDEGVVDYIRATLGLFRSLPTYKWLEEWGIVPDEDARYDLDDFIEALASGWVEAIQARGEGGGGMDGGEVRPEPIVRCGRHGEVREVWYYFHALGPLQAGRFVPTEAVRKESNCPERVKYLPKGKGSEVSRSNEL